MLCGSNDRCHLQMTPGVDGVNKEEGKKNSTCARTGSKLNENAWKTIPVSSLSVKVSRLRFAPYRWGWN